MIIIIGADGHVGSATAGRLLQKDKSILVVLHTDEKEKYWKKAGAETAVVDVNDINALQRIFNRGKKAFILNPPASPSTDTVAVEKMSVDAIIQALENTSITRVVAESTYGAQEGEGIGDLGVLFNMEQGLARLPLVTTIIRAAYYMSNWDQSLASARSEGIVHTLYPPDFKIPMVAPDDIGRFAAGFLTEAGLSNHIHYVEGPAYYSAADVAMAFSKALGKSVAAEQTPEKEWEDSLVKNGFSIPAAKSMAAMTKITLEEKFTKPVAPDKGTTGLENYIKQLVEKKSPGEY